MRHGDELQTICLSEKGRYITFIGRVKEDVKNLREIHSVMDPQRTELFSCNKTVLALSGDLKYMLTMLGHTGATVLVLPTLAHVVPGVGRSSPGAVGFRRSLHT